MMLKDDDPRQVRALEAATTAVDEYVQLKGPKTLARPRMMSRKAISAYFSALQKEGVVPVEKDASASFTVKKYGSTFRLDKEGWHVTPPCKACEGTGCGQGAKCECDPTDPSPLPAERQRNSPCFACPRCNGSGLARMVALDDVVEALASAGHGRYTKAGIEKAADFIEARFSGTGEEPHG